MSSSYYILCLSHDPAITVSDCGSADGAADAIAAGIEGHLDCDLLIERVSGAPVEYGCPPFARRPAGPHCYHRDVRWEDTAWLRLLGRAHESTDPRIQDAVTQGRFGCWPVERVRRLRHQIGNAEELQERP